jgi:hypothetical protein
VCREFTQNAFGLGNWLFAGVHKPYFYTDLTMEQDEE